MQKEEINLVIMLISEMQKEEINLVNVDFLPSSTPIVLQDQDLWTISEGLENQFLQPKETTWFVLTIH